MQILLGFFDLPKRKEFSHPAHTRKNTNVTLRFPILWRENRENNSEKRTQPRFRIETQFVLFRDAEKKDMNADESDIAYLLPLSAIWFHVQWAESSELLSRTTFPILPHRKKKETEMPDVATACCRNHKNDKSALKVLTDTSQARYLIPFSILVSRYARA